MSIKCWSSARDVLVNGWSKAGHIDNVDKIDKVDIIDKMDNIDEIENKKKITIYIFDNIDKIDNIHKIDNMDQSPSSVGQVLVKCWSSAGDVFVNGWSRAGYIDNIYFFFSYLLLQYTK